MYSFDLCVTEKENVTATTFIIVDTIVIFVTILTYISLRSVIYTCITFFYISVKIIFRNTD